jgi:hypothetical protein
VSLSPGALVQTLTFGDLKAGLWGVAWLPTAGEGFIAVGAPSHACFTVTAPSLEGSGPAGEWKVSGDGVSLVVTPVGEPASLRLAGAHLQGFDQLCRVVGRVRVGEVEHRVDCPGGRGGRSGHWAAQSVRELAAWFDDDEGLAVVSVRGPKAAGHDADVLSAALFEAGQPIGVAEPRLSTTYAASGVPSRASLELWLDGEDPDSDAAVFPRRAAGEAVGRGGVMKHGGLEVRAELFRWHMRGRDGTGVYQLIRRR